MAGTYLIEKKEMDPVTLAINIISIGAGIYVMIRLGAIAVAVMAKSGAQDDSVPVDADLLRDKPSNPFSRKEDQESQQTWFSFLPCLSKQSKSASSVELV